MEFTVKGGYEFPIDMLRFDACHPVSEDDSKSITEMMYPEGGTVEVRLSTPKSYPTVGRWRSFGWPVTSP